MTNFATWDLSHRPSARAVAEAGAISWLSTARLRQGHYAGNDQTLLQRYKAELDVMIMAEISTAEEGRIAASGGADILSTTIAGYTRIPVNWTSRITG